MTNVLPLFPDAPAVPRIVFGRAHIGSLVDRAVELTCIPRGNVVGADKTPESCMARWAIIRVARDRGKSYAQIGRVLGGRDHSTMFTGYQRAIGLERTDQDFATLVRLLREVPPL